MIPASNVRRVTFDEVNDPASPWPQGFRPSVSECPLTHKKCARGCGDICRDFIENEDD